MSCGKCKDYTEWILDFTISVYINEKVIASLVLKKAIDYGKSLTLSKKNRKIAPNLW